MSFSTIIWIFLGGGFGTLVRYGIGTQVSGLSKSSFPIGTLAVNLIGCLIIGLIYGYFEKHQETQSDWKLILTIGFCGGFTTFSAFSIDAIQLVKGGNLLLAILYIFSSVFIGILLSILGWQIAKNY